MCCMTRAVKNQIFLDFFKMADSLKRQLICNRNCFIVFLSYRLNLLIYLIYLYGTNLFKENVLMIVTIGNIIITITIFNILLNSSLWFLRSLVFYSVKVGEGSQIKWKEDFQNQIFLVLKCFKTCEIKRIDYWKVLNLL